jgi:hypothetical protein
MNIRYDYYRNLDIISDYQSVYIWKFDSEKIITSSKYSDYSLPLRISLFKIFLYLASSSKKIYRLRHFTIWMGDIGPPNNFFSIAIPAITSRVIRQLFNTYYSIEPGYSGSEFNKIPCIPLIPVYRYEYGRIIEYCYDEKLAGKFVIDNKYNSGLSVQYREWVSAESFSLNQRYGG